MTADGISHIQHDDEIDLRPNILVVDDELAVIQALHRRIRKEFRLIPATDPAYAVELLRAGLDLSVVMSDLRMPRLSGLDVLAIAKETHPRVPRVLFTGHAAEVAERPNSSLPHENVVLLKPLDAAQVARYLRGLIVDSIMPLPAS